MSGPLAAPLSSSPPIKYYADRLAACEGVVDFLARRDVWVGRARLAAFALILLAFWLSFGFLQLPSVIIALPAAGFIWLLFYHDRLRGQLSSARRAVAFYQQGTARLEERWIGQGLSGDRFMDADHAYSADLDLFGTGSLFELLCATRTTSGQDTLAAWLLAPAAAEIIRARQDAVKEMRSMLELRERLHVLGGAIPAGVDLAGLAAWGVAPLVLHRPKLRLAAVLLAGATLFMIVWCLVGPHGLIPCLLLLLGEAAFAWHYHEQVDAIIKPIEKRAGELAIFAGVLALFERAPFQSARLQVLQKALATEGRPPSMRIAELNRLIDWLNSRRNPFFAILAPFLLWKTQHALAIEEWRSHAGPAIKRWLDAVGELEALSCLAAFAYEHPGDIFPEIESAGAQFEAADLGHPLLPARACIRNDVHLDPACRLLVVSGSNMSGKSTLLRTIGVNAVLAYAGAPVRAKRLRLTPLQIGATLRIQDSLQAGRSRFFAEIQRIRQLLDLAKKPPGLLFLLDELLHGTNSHDRRLGAEAIVHSLLQSGAIGLLTTHDLALTQLTQVLEPLAVNVHFEDHFEHGAMTFDYRMRPGVVEKSNAVALMKAVGIPIDADRRF
jgi:MutS domain V